MYLQYVEDIDTIESIANNDYMHSLACPACQYRQSRSDAVGREASAYG